MTTGRLQAFQRSLWLPHGGPGWVALLATSVAAAPAVFLGALAASIGFSGCLIECGEPDPVAGLTWTAVAVAALFAPFLATRIVQLHGLPIAARWFIATWAIALAIAFNLVPGMLGSVLPR